MRELSHRTRKDVYRGCEIEMSGRVNIHHIIFKSDYKRGLVPRDFCVNSRCNLIPLPVDVHNELHKIVQETPAFRNNIDSRIWLANYAFNGDLSDI